jgi:hypothetical protein
MVWLSLMAYVLTRDNIESERIIPWCWLLLLLEIGRRRGGIGGDDGRVC